MSIQTRESNIDFWSRFCAVIQGDLTNVPLGDWVRSLAEEETVLPCVYKRTQEEVVVQVTWMKKKSDGTKEQIILAHHISGQTGTVYASICTGYKMTFLYEKFIWFETTLHIKCSVVGNQLLLLISVC